MIRFHFTFNKEAMSGWLNEMAADGWLLNGFGAGFCSFRRGVPGSLEYQIDMVPAPGAMRQDYRELMTDLGIDVVCRWGPWIVLARTPDGRPFELYTDTESRITHLKRSERFFKVMALFEILCFLLLLLSMSSFADWEPLLIVCALIALAAGIAMGARAAALENEATILMGNDPLLLRPRRVLTAGLFILLAGLLLKGGAAEDVGDFFCGFGCALVITGSVFCIRNRRRYLQD